jgi:hypothetical protein
MTAAPAADRGRTGLASRIDCTLDKPEAAPRANPNTPFAMATTTTVPSQRGRTPRIGS